jgi:hypothetical protein
MYVAWGGRRGFVCTQALSFRAYPSAFREINVTVFIYSVSVLLLVELGETEITFSCKSLSETG